MIEATHPCRFWSDVIHECTIFGAMCTHYEGGQTQPHSCSHHWRQLAAMLDNRLRAVLRSLQSLLDAVKEGPGI